MDDQKTGREKSLWWVAGVVVVVYALFPVAWIV
jgi:multiple sugar transport system permease protein